MVSRAGFLLSMLMLLAGLLRPQCLTPADAALQPLIKRRSRALVGSPKTAGSRDRHWLKGDAVMQLRLDTSTDYLAGTDEDIAFRITVKDSHGKGVNWTGVMDYNILQYPYNLQFERGQTTCLTSGFELSADACDNYDVNKQSANIQLVVCNRGRSPTNPAWKVGHVYLRLVCMGGSGGDTPREYCWSERMNEFVGVIDDPHQPGKMFWDDYFDAGRGTYTLTGRYYEKCTTSCQVYEYIPLIYDYDGI